MALPRERLTTEHLVLEPVTPELAAAIVAGDPSAVTAGEGWPHEDTLDGLRMAARGDGGTAWLVTRDGLVIGDAGTHGPPEPSGDVEIGYGLAAPAHGHGHGTEVVAAVTAWLLAQDGVTRVVAREVRADNVPSRRALERAGFVVEAAGAGHVSYACARA